MNRIPYGSTFLELPPLPNTDVEYYLPKTASAGNKEKQLSRVNNALKQGEILLKDRLETESRNINEITVGIAVNDPTRPIPNEMLLPPLLDLLQSLGILARNITIFIATGTHKDLTKQELINLLGKDIYQNIRTVVHVCDSAMDLTFLGKSSIGTPIYVNSEFYHCDLKIVTGHIEPHHFMGYSGGVKSAAIGLGGMATIEANHKLISDPQAIMGLFDENPMRQDIEEIGEIIGIDLALNVVLNDEKQIIEAFSGDPLKVMAKGIELSREICSVDLKNKFDIVFASPGGYPKDINLYQSQKAITHACNFLNPGGVVVLCAECREGFGSTKFEEFFIGKNGPEEIILAFESNIFTVGPHKAYQLALQQKNYKIFLLSSLNPPDVRKAFIEPVESITDALDHARSLLPENPQIAILPFATHLIAN